MGTAACFGLISSPLAVLSIPCAYLIGLTVASIALILRATASTISAMNNFFTVFIIPMFYVSGVFSPLDHVPHTVKMLFWALPLTIAAALTRGLVSGDLTWSMVLWALPPAIGYFGCGPLRGVLLHAPPPHQVAASVVATCL